MASRDSGTAALAARIEESRRRKTATTPITRPMESSRVNSTSSTLARMVPERSLCTLTCTPPGTQPSSCGSMARTPSTTSRTLASACLYTCSSTEGRLSKKPACRRLRIDAEFRISPG